jgi:diguanylate cyclase (GGDEF)-like protein
MTSIPPAAPERAPRLVLRFAAYTAAALLVAATGILLFVRYYATGRAQTAAAFHTRFVADTILRGQLRAADFDRPVSGARLRQLDALFREEVLVSGALRVKLYGRDARVTYSNDHTLIGTLPSDAEHISHALAGKTVSEVGSLNAEGGSGRDTKVLEAYAPVRLGGERPAGVFELYQDYAPIAKTARDAFFPVAGVLVLVLLALYAALFPILRRVTGRLRRQMDEIEHQALHDALTGLPNRLLFGDRVEQALLAARREPRHAAVLLIDLDRFKEINDTLGHQSGDLLLRQLGPRLQGALRASDTVARLGGDEFAVLLPNVADAEASLAIARKLLQALEEPFAIDGLVLEIEASVGVSVFPEHGYDTETLLRRADLAMYVAKEAHAGAVLYEAEHDHYSPARLTLVADLRRALQRRELTLYYQPKACVEDGSVHAVEALVRWQHPERGLLSPNDFIPLAEHTGLIRPLTLYVLEAALRQCRAWREQGIRVGVAVNLSGRDLLDLNLPDEVAGLLGESGVDAADLELEITESTILTDPLRARAVLVRLSELGVKLAIDDFGSGYSSLGYLKRLPVDVLKIDKSFVMQMESDENDAVIVRSTIDLGHNLGLMVVAEGVESDAALEELARLGCDIAQGYYLSRPLPPDEVTAWLRSSRARPSAAGKAELRIARESSG